MFRHATVALKRFITDMHFKKNKKSWFVFIISKLISSLSKQQLKQNNNNKNNIFTAALFMTLKISCYISCKQNFKIIYIRVHLIGQLSFIVVVNGFAFDLAALK